MTAAKERTTVVSTKGQVVLPASLREKMRWKPGTQLVVEETDGGVLLKPAPIFPPTRMDDVYGCLPYKGPAKTIEEMNKGIVREIRRRHARGRY